MFRMPQLAVAATAALLCVASYAQASREREQVLQTAAALLQDRQLTAAEEKLRALIAENPADALALNLLGLVRLQQQKPAEAVDFFQRAIATGRNIAGPHINLALVYGPEQPRKAISELKLALKISPDNKQALTLLRDIAKKAALVDMQRGDKQAAAEVLSSARSVSPHDSELLYDSGFVAYESGFYEDADRWLTGALKLRPNYPDASYALARTYLAESLARPAEDQMRRYLADKPDDASAQYGLGYILMAEQKVTEAKAAFQRSLALQPNQTESVYQLGEIALQENQVDQARNRYKEVLARDPHHGGALTGLGVLAYREAKYDDAKADLERAIGAAPTYQKAHYYYALTLAHLGQKAEAQHEFEVAKSLQKEHGGEHHLLADQP